MSVLHKPGISKKDLQIINKRRLDHYNKNIRMRLNILWFSRCCDSADDIALYSGCSRRQVFLIFQLYSENGLNAVMQINKHKHESELNNFSDLIVEEFTNTPPSSIKEARLRILKLTGIKRSHTQIAKFLKKLGMRLLKPTPVPMAVGDKDLSEKTQKQREFVDEKLVPILEEEKQGKRKVLFMDACHVQLTCLLGVIWCFAKKYIKALPQRGRINVIGACSAYGEDIHHTASNCTVPSKY